MFRHERPGLGTLVQSLSRKIDDLQRDMAELRRDVRNLVVLVREQRARVESDPLSDQEDEPGSRLNSDS